MDDLASLRLQLEWGADEALQEVPVDRRTFPALSEPKALPVVALVTQARPGLAALAQAQALAAAATSPAELAAALAQFDGCALRATATNLVFSDGNPAARLVLVADVPGAAEDRAGIPFAGSAAMFLDRMFLSAGLDRAAWLSTSLLPWRPPGDRKPADHEIQLCLPFLLRHLQLIQPKRVVLFGGLAARALLPASGRLARGVWHEMAVPGIADGISTMALPSSAHIQATPAAKREAWAGLLRLYRALEADSFVHKNFNTTLDTPTFPRVNDLSPGSVVPTGLHSTT